MISKYYNSIISEKIWKLANDSIKNWEKSNLQSWKYDPSKGENTLDTTVCINKIGNKAVMAILSHDFSPNAKLEAIGFFYGIKIKNKWYFFTGATCYLPRKNYTKDIHMPLSFAKLHEIAMREVFSGYLIKKKKYVGFWKNIFAPEYEYEINDNFFSELDRIVRDAREQEEKYHGRSFKSTEEYMDWFARSSVEANWHKK